MAAKQTKQPKQPAKPSPAPSKPSPAKDPATADRQWLIAGLLGLFAILLYANTLGHGFVLDDPLVTTLNAYVKKGLGGLGDIFAHSYRAGSSVSTDSEYMYRPLSVALFAIEWAIAPNKASVHHWMNVLWYAGTVMLLFFTLSKLLRNSHLWLVIATTALFAAHPVHTEVVANIKSRDEILCLFFSLLCISRVWDYAQGKGARALLVALFAFFLALLSKEGAITLVVIVPLILYFFDKERSLGQAFRASAWMWIPLILWFLLRAGIMQGKMAYTPNVNDNQLVAVGLMERWATSFVVLGKYLQLLVWPATLSWDYSYNQIPTTNWGDWKALLSFTLHGSLLYVGIRYFRQRSVWAFCALAYGASMLLLYSNLFLLIGAIIGERLLYQASLWYCLALAAALIALLRVQARAGMPLLADTKERWLAIALGGLVLVMSIRTYLRNADWESDYTLFTADSQNAPNSFRAQRGAAEQMLLAYNKNKEPMLMEQAETTYKRSLAIKPTEHAYTGLGIIEYNRKNYEGALGHFSKGRELAPNDNSIREKIVGVYKELGENAGKVNNDLPKAIAYFAEALTVDSTDYGSWLQMGTAYGMQNKHTEAIRCFERALRNKAGDKAALSNLSIAYRMLGDVAKSEEYAQKAAAVR